LERWEAVRKTELECREMRGRLEYELQRRLEVAEATELAHPTLEVTLKSASPIYDTPRLYALLGEGLIPPEVLNTGYTPEHTRSELVPARFDGTKINSWHHRYGREVREAIDACKFVGRPTLVIKPRNQQRAKVD
jgi:hypothetical protein